MPFWLVSWRSAHGIVHAVVHAVVLHFRFRCFRSHFHNGLSVDVQSAGIPVRQGCLRMAFRNRWIFMDFFTFSDTAFFSRCFHSRKSMGFEVSRFRGTAKHLNLITMDALRNLLCFMESFPLDSAVTVVLSITDVVSLNRSCVGSTLLL
jgi:hypothetical protein